METAAQEAQAVRPMSAGSAADQAAGMSAGLAGRLAAGLAAGLTAVLAAGLREVGLHQTESGLRCGRGVQQ